MLVFFRGLISTFVSMLFHLNPYMQTFFFTEKHALLVTLSILDISTNSIIVQCTPSGKYITSVLEKRTAEKQSPTLEQCCGVPGFPTLPG